MGKLRSASISIFSVGNLYNNTTWFSGKVQPKGGDYKSCFALFEGPW